jgi:hypothetical protein
LNEAIEIFSELKRLHQLNAELLEELYVSVEWLTKHNIPLPNSDTLLSLLSKSKSLLLEIQATEPKILQYSLSRRKVTDSDNSQEGNTITNDKPYIHPLSILSR